MTDTTQVRSISTWAISLVAIVFGALTIKEGGAVLFGGDAARATAGHYIPFIVWFNFLAGFAYVVAGFGLLLRRRWAIWLAVSIAAATALASAALGLVMLSGTPFEQRTVFAMGLRTVVWVTIAGIAWRRRAVGAT